MRQFAVFRGTGIAMITREANSESGAVVQGMANLIWTKQLSVGNLVIDSGHQDLIGMINILEYAIGRRDGPQLLRMFGKFCDSAQLHFKDEEKIMLAVRFPFIPHKLEHQHLLDGLQNTLNELAAKNGVWAEYVMDHYPGFLRDWFVGHINGGIATLKPFLEEHPYDFIPA